MNILIVDDCLHIREQLNIVLRAGGHNHLFFADSPDKAFAILGVQCFPPNPERIDLILMDIEMQEMDGIAAVRRITAERALRDIPIVMVTADTRSKSLQQAFDAGAVDYITKPVKKIELLARVQSLLRLKNERDIRRLREKELVLLTRIQEETNLKLKEANARLEKIARNDALTGIDNRRVFDENLLKEWKRSQRHSRPLGLIMADIDHFKLYNDTYGHQQGDECLKTIAAVLQNSLRREADSVARYGGEEFVSLLPETDENGAMLVAQRMLRAVEELGLPHGASPDTDYVTISIGTSCAVASARQNPQELLAAADKALYQAKERGRGRAIFYWEQGDRVPATPPFTWRKN